MNDDMSDISTVDSRIDLIAAAIGGALLMTEKTYCLSSIGRPVWVRFLPCRLDFRLRPVDHWDLAERVVLESLRVRARQHIPGEYLEMRRDQPRPVLDPIRIWPGDAAHETRLDWSQLPFPRAHLVGQP